MYPKIECIHPGATKNNNVYLSEKLKGDPTKFSGIYSWTHPYPKPMCYDHNIYDARNISGRIINAQYIAHGQSGKEAVVIIPEIRNKEDIKKILNGELLTVSISAHTNSMTCSICGTNLVDDGYCGHVRGRKYDGKLCQYVAGDIWFQECSWVTVPADERAQVVDVGSADAYAKKQEDFINLTKKPEEAVMKEAAVLLEGFIEEPNIQSQGSEGDMDTSKDTEQKDIQTQDTSCDTGNQDNVDNTKDKDAAKDTPKDVQDDVKDTGAKKDQDGVKENHTVDYVTQADLEHLQSQIAELSVTVTDLMVEKAEQEKKKTTLEQELLESYVDRIIDLRLMAGKITQEDVEETRKELSARTKESLKDTLIDLKRDIDIVPSSASLRGTVKNPGAGVAENKQKNDLVEGKVGKKLDPVQLLKEKLTNQK